jgi:hypothetical protein
MGRAHPAEVEALMALFAFVAPILPGKRSQWDAFIAELAGPRHSEFAASRQRVGVRERTFVQETPMGDMVIVTLEGDSPAEGMMAFANSDDPFTGWFLKQVEEIHGFDLRHPPGDPPHQVLDSQAT